MWSLMISRFKSLNLQCVLIGLSVDVIHGCVNTGGTFKHHFFRNKSDEIHVIFARTWYTQYVHRVNEFYITQSMYMEYRQVNYNKNELVPDMHT